MNENSAPLKPIELEILNILHRALEAAIRVAMDPNLSVEERFRALAMAYTIIQQIAKERLMRRLKTGGRNSNRWNPFEAQGEPEITSSWDTPSAPGNRPSQETGQDSQSFQSPSGWDWNEELHLHGA